MLEEFGKVSHLPSQDYEGALFDAQNAQSAQPSGLAYYAQIFCESRLQPTVNYPTCSQ